jgi:hypothetical protein
MIDRRTFLKLSLIISGVLTGGTMIRRTLLSSDYKMSEPTYKIKERHPRIYLTSERLQAIRRRCADKRGAQSTYYSRLKEFAEKYIASKNKPSVNNCLMLAFIYAVGEVNGYDYSKRSTEECGKLGVDILTKLAPPNSYSYFSRYTPYLIACYDWLFPAMISEQRAMVFQNFSAIADAMSKKVPVLGQYRGTAEMYGYYGLAFYGDGKDMFPNNLSTAAEVDKKAIEYLNFFTFWHIDQQLAIWETACKGGAYPAGTMYGEDPIPMRLWPLDAWDTSSEVGVYEKNSVLTEYPFFWMYQMLPFRTQVRYDNAYGRANQLGGVVRFGDYRYIGYSAVASRLLDINVALAQGIKIRQRRPDLSSVLNWLIQCRGDFMITPFGGPIPTNRGIEASPFLVWDIIFREGLIEAKSPREVGLPLAYHFGSTDSGPPLKPDFPHGRPEGGGVVVMRSAWDDPDSTLLWFKASSHAVIHSHRDQGSFQIYKKGWLAIDSGQYEETTHLGNYTSRTIAHNSILVYSPGETMAEDKVNPIWHGYANDGGQRWGDVPRTVSEIKDTQNFLGGVTKFESIPGIYDYIHADITRSYNSSYVTDKFHPAKVALVTRNLLFLRPDEYIVIFDRVSSTKAEYPKRWLLHSIYRPELDGTEIFEGVIPYSHKIPGKPQGVCLRGDKRGGISESKDSSIIIIKGWNFGPSDGRLICRTLLPQQHITRIVGGSDSKGVSRTYLVKPNRQRDSSKDTATIFVKNVDGFEVGDFVYWGPTDKPYSNGSYGRPNWPVDDIFYQGWGKIKSIDKKTNSITMLPYHYSIPDLPEGTLVIRSDHANANSFEFMDAEYNQWQMYGEAVAVAGPFHMQHGSWRIEVEPITKQKDDFFIHVMLPCENKTLVESQRAVRENVKVAQGNKTVELEIKGKKRMYKVAFHSDLPDARITVTDSGKTILDNHLTLDAIKARAK